MCVWLHVTQPVCVLGMADVMSGLRIQRLSASCLVLRRRMVGCDGVECFVAAPRVSAVSTTPSGGNLVDGPPPAASLQPSIAREPTNEFL